MKVSSEKKMTRIVVHLSFTGNCREAMSFYQTCFGGNLNCMTVSESPMHNQWPEEAQQLILHATLINKTLQLLASDMGTADAHAMPHAISLALECATEKELHLFFERLSTGGKITHPPHSFFDGTIAALCDKYGINWILKF